MRTKPIPEMSKNKFPAIAPSVIIINPEKNNPLPKLLTSRLLIASYTSLLLFYAIVTIIVVRDDFNAFNHRVTKEHRESNESRLHYYLL